MPKNILVLKHIEIEGPGTIGHFFRNTRWPLRTVNLAGGEALPDTFRDIEAVISLGGPMNVYEEADHPFLKEEDAFLKDAVEKEIPVIGICLGAQLLAKTCGAKVKRAHTKEIGWYKVDLTAEGEKDPLFKGLPKTFEVFQWHEDTFDIPEGAVLLARSRSCPNQAFRVGKNAYGLQFHVEVTPEMIEDWISGYIKEEGTRIAFADMLTRAHKEKGAFRRQGDILSLNYARIIKDRSAGKK